MDTPVCEVVGTSTSESLVYYYTKKESWLITRVAQQKAHFNLSEISIGVLSGIIIAVFLFCYDQSSR